MEECTTNINSYIRKYMRLQYEEEDKRNKIKNEEKLKRNKANKEMKEKAGAHVAALRIAGCLGIFKADAIYGAREGTAYDTYRMYLKLISFVKKHPETNVLMVKKLNDKEKNIYELTKKRLKENTANAYTDMYRSMQTCTSRGNYFNFYYAIKPSHSITNEDFEQTLPTLPIPPLTDKELIEDKKEIKNRINVIAKHVAARQGVLKAQGVRLGDRVNLNVTSRTKTHYEITYTILSFIRTKELDDIKQEAFERIISLSIEKQNLLDDKNHFISNAKNEVVNRDAERKRRIKQAEQVYFKVARELSSQGRMLNRNQRNALELSRQDRIRKTSEIEKERRIDYNRHNQLLGNEEEKYRTQLSILEEKTKLDDCKVSGTVNINDTDDGEPFILLDLYKRAGIRKTSVGIY